MTVSIIVPAFNCAPYIERSLESLLAQSYSNIEIVVVDDGSSDETLQIARRVAAGDRRIKVLSQHASGRAAAARNAGIRVSSGEFVAFLDADDLYSRDKIHAEISAFDSRPGLGIVFCDVAKFTNDDTRELQPGFLEELGFLEIAASQLEHIGGNRYLCGEDFYNFMSSQITSLATPSVLIRRSALLREPYWFNENLVAGEDVDLWFRLARHCRIGFVAEVLAYYRQREGSLTGDTERVLRGAIDAHGANLERGRDRLSAVEIALIQRRLARQYSVLAYHMLVKGKRNAARTAYLKCRQLDRAQFSAVAFAKTYVPTVLLNLSRTALARLPGTRPSQR